MTRVGLGLPGLSVAEVAASAAAAAPYGYDSFSVYGDLGDLPPYAVLPLAAPQLADSTIANVGPLGVPVGLQHPENIAMHAIALDQQLPGRTSVGLVRGAFLEAIGEAPASLERLEATVKHLRQRFAEHGADIPIVLGGFGPRLLRLAGRLGVAGVKLGGSANVRLAEQARAAIANDQVKLILGAVSVIDPDRRAARTRARQEVAKYLDVVGPLDTTLDAAEAASLAAFRERFANGDPQAGDAISDALLDKFAVAGTPEDALSLLRQMDGVVDRFEFGTPHGLDPDRAVSIRYIGQTIVHNKEEL